MTVLYHILALKRTNGINNVQVQFNYAPGIESNAVWTAVGNGNYSLTLSSLALTYPGGTWAPDNFAYAPDHRQAQIVLTIPWTHNFNNDWSFKNLQTDIYDDPTQNYGLIAPNIAIYGSSSSTGTSQLLGGNPLGAQ